MVFIVETKQRNMYGKIYQRKKEPIPDDLLHPIRGMRSRSNHDENLFFIAVAPVCCYCKPAHVIDINDGMLA